MVWNNKRFAGPRSDQLFKARKCIIACSMHGLVHDIPQSLNIKPALTAVHRTCKENKNLLCVTSLLSV